MIGISELDCLTKEDKYGKPDENQHSKEVHKDFVNFMNNEMEYDSKIVESDVGMAANAIFFKRNKFKLVQHGSLDLNYKRNSAVRPGSVPKLNKKNGKQGVHTCAVCHLAPKN